MIGTAHPGCFAKQNMVFNRYKLNHSLKFQSVISLEGILNACRSIVGRGYNWVLFARKGMVKQLDAKCLVNIVLK